LAEHREKIKRVFNKIGINIDKTDIKPTTIKRIDFKLAQLCKVDLANYPLEKI
jgi:hypothetical protein